MRTPSPRRIGRALRLLVALPALFFAQGCKDERTVIGLLLPDRFPGGTVAENDVADDRRAMSINGQNAGLLVAARNGATGAAVALFLTSPGGSEQHLWATHWDGRTFTPPVELVGERQDPFTWVGQLPVVCFLNTSGFSLGTTAENAAVRARDGDAVILWVRRDLPQDPAAADDDPGQNLRLYYAYFDASLRDRPRATADVRGNGPETVLHGFTETGLILDTLDEGPTGADPTAENVMSLGVVSDGLLGATDWVWGSAGQEWGDPVTHIVAVWTQLDDAEDTGADPDTFEDNVPYDEKLFLAPLNLQTGVFAAPTEGGLAGALGSNTGDTRDQTLAANSADAYRLWTYNNVLINRYEDDPDGVGNGSPALPAAIPGDGVQTVFTLTLPDTPVEPASVIIDHRVIAGASIQTFSDSGVGDGTLTGSLGDSGDIDYDTGDATITFAVAPAVGEEVAVVTYGQNAASDTVLAATIFTPTPTGATFAEVEISPAHAARAFASVADSPDSADLHGTDEGLQEVLAFFRFDGQEPDPNPFSSSSDDDEADIFVARIPATAADFSPADDVVQVSVDTATLSGGQDVEAGTLRTAVDRTGAFVPVIWLQGAPAAQDTEEDVALYGSIVQDGTVAFAQGTAGGLIHPAQLLSDQTGLGVLNPVEDAAFQRGLGYFFGVQSDFERVNVLFIQQSDATGGTDPDELYAVQLFADPAGDETTTPFSRVLVTNAFGEDELAGSLADHGIQGIDAGAGGEVFVLWARDKDLASADGLRFFAAEVDPAGLSVDPPGGVAIGSNSDDRDAEPVPDQVRLSVAPLPTTIGTTGDFAARRIDVLFEEERGDGISTALRHRAYDATRADSATFPFDERFTPDVAGATPPFEVDTHQHTTPLLTAGSLADVPALLDGRPLGLYFLQDGHLYYNEFDGTRWIEELGDIEPQLVDNDSAQNVWSWWISVRPGRADRLPRSIAFFVKDDGDGDQRLHARVHD